MRGYYERNKANRGERSALCGNGGHKACGGKRLFNGQHVACMCPCHGTICPSCKQPRPSKTAAALVAAAAQLENMAREMRRKAGQVTEVTFKIQPTEGGFYAKAKGHSIHTQGATVEAAKANCLDAVAVHFDYPVRVTYTERAQ